MTPRFSILHPTRRLPDGWVESAERWMMACSAPSRCEYVLCWDELREINLPDKWRYYWKEILECVVNDGRQSSTTAYNCAAAASTGDILICNADDVFPPRDWDLLIDRALLKGTPAEIDPLQRDFILHPSTGNSRDSQVIFQPFMSRHLYEKWRYFFYEQYNAMYADDDLSEHARQDGVIIPAFNIRLEHRHPALTGREEDVDETYLWENRPENYEVGKRLIEERRARRFAS